MIIYYLCSKNHENIRFIRECIDFCIKYVHARHAITRITSQILILTLLEKFNLIDAYKSFYDCIQLVRATKISQVLYSSFKYRFEKINVNEMLNSQNTLREIPRITGVVSDEYYKYDIYDEENPNMVNDSYESWSEVQTLN